MHVFLSLSISLPGTNLTIKVHEPLKSLKTINLQNWELIDKCSTYFLLGPPCRLNQLWGVSSVKKIKKLSRKFSFFYFVGLTALHYCHYWSIVFQLLLADTMWARLLSSVWAALILGACNCTITDIDASGPCRHTLWTNQQESSKFSPGLITTTTSTQRLSWGTTFQNRKEYQLLQNPRW